MTNRYKRLKHGLSETSEYLTWSNMRQRCHNPNDRKFRWYRGRGITVCERWMHDFSAFYADMGPRPGTGWSIDRIDNDGPYAPDNCRWATRETQLRDRQKPEIRWMTEHKALVSVRLPAVQVEFLKAETDRLGISLGELLRRIIDQYREGRGT